MTEKQRKRLRALLIDYGMAMQRSSDDEEDERLHAKELAALERALDYAEKVMQKDPAKVRCVRMIAAFDKACRREEYTDTGEAWNLLNAIRRLLGGAE